MSGVNNAIIIRTKDDKATLDLFLSCRPHPSTGGFQGEPHIFFLGTELTFPFPLVNELCNHTELGPVLRMPVTRDALVHVTWSGQNNCGVTNGPGPGEGAAMRGSATQVKNVMQILIAGGGALHCRLSWSQSDPGASRWHVIRCRSRTGRWLDEPIEVFGLLSTWVSPREKLILGHQVERDASNVHSGSRLCIHSPLLWLNR